jgi:acyl-coenzyme A synthetase/AMP-(fatty) acid ligase
VQRGRRVTNGGRGVRHSDGARGWRSPVFATTTEELIAFCRQHLAPFKTPKHWRFVDQFPQTASGKVQKFALRERFLSMSV